MKHSSIIQYSSKALQNTADAIQALAAAEGLASHADSVRLRMQSQTDEDA
jgi:histidinol dehydrogenase